MTFTIDKLREEIKSLERMCEAAGITFVPTRHTIFLHRELYMDMITDPSYYKERPADRWILENQMKFEDVHIAIIP